MSTVYQYSGYFTNNPIAPYWFIHNAMCYIRQLDRKYHFICSTRPRIDTETSIFYVIVFDLKIFWKYILKAILSGGSSMMILMKRYGQISIHFENVYIHRIVIFETRFRGGWKLILRWEDVNMASPNAFRVFSLFICQVLIVLVILLCVSAEINFLLFFCYNILYT